MNKDNRKTIKVEETVKDQVVCLKQEQGFKTESETIQHLIDFYRLYNDRTTLEAIKLIKQIKGE
jgi:hypothetical protein